MRPISFLKACNQRTLHLHYQQHSGILEVILHLGLVLSMDINLPDEALPDQHQGVEVCALRTVFLLSVARLLLRHTVALNL